MGSAPWVRHEIARFQSQTAAAYYSFQLTFTKGGP
jgi:hypothetical protein